MSSGNNLLLAIAASVSMLAGACADPMGSASGGSRGAGEPLMASSTRPSLVECPTAQTVAAQGEIGLLGGSLTAAGTTIDIPAGAVLSPTLFTLVVPASNYMEISITAGEASHFDFEDAVSISIDYSRCSRANIDKAPLSVYYIDEGTKALLENMGGSDDKDARKVRFITDHLSGYAIAN